MATKANFTVDQGTDWLIEINISDSDIVDVSGYTARAQMRRHYQSATGYTLSAYVHDTNTIRLSLEAANTSAIPAGRYVYDVEITSAGNVVSRLVEGLITVTPEVTKL